MVRKILAVIAGIAVTMIIISLVDMMVSRLSPSTANIDFEDAKALGMLMHKLPRGTFAGMLAGYAFGSFLGGLIASLLSGRTSIQPAVIIGVMAMVGGIFNLFQLPHPLWFVIASQFAYIPFACLGFLLVRQDEKPLYTGA
jgi:hypothetical protein